MDFNSKVTQKPDMAQVVKTHRSPNNGGTLGLSPAAIQSTAWRLNSGLYLLHFLSLACSDTFYLLFGESVPSHCLVFPPHATCNPHTI